MGERGKAEAKLRLALAAVAPGTALREGLERILRGRTGALVVLGYDRTVESICTGGFVLDVDFSATGLRELAKMDGAIVVDRECTKILRAATQLVPDPSIPTTESGTRHRTAERVAKQTGFPVISVSQSMRIVAIYVDHVRYVLEDAGQILSRANQALATLEADGAFPAIVICPASMKLMWERETGRWLPQRSVAILDGRIVTRTYGRVFLDTLPTGLPRTSAIEQVRRWWMVP